MYKKNHGLKGFVFCCLFALCFPGLGAEAWRTVFDPYAVLSLHLQMESNDWERVRHDQPSQNESWIPEIAEAWLWAEGEIPIRVTLRRKGESDIPLPEEGNPQKVSLKIDINALVPGQKWRGLTKLSLENGSDNPLTEGFAWLVHRLAWEGGFYGYEAANAGWVKLYINGELKGVFVNAEQRCQQFLQNHGFYKEQGTWLYKVDGTTALEVGIGDSPAFHHLCYPPFNSGPGAGDTGGCTQPDLEVDLPQWINVQGFLTLGAVDAFLENRDALFSHSGKNSFAVDFDPPYPRTRLYFPWDLDTTIRQGTESIYGTAAYQTTFLRHPWFGQIYEQIIRDLLDGPFAVTNLEAVIDRLQAAVGPAFDEDPYVYSGQSADAFDSLRQWVRTRVPNVRSQLVQPYIGRVQFNQNGGEVVAGFNLSMSAPTGTVYYTLDGTDPRAPGGAVAASAVAYTAPLVIDQTRCVIARAFDGSVWSALPTKATFNLARYASALRITEIMYHPFSELTGLEDYFEFLELKNTGPEPLNLSGFYFEGISYAFPANTMLGAGSFFVLARNGSAFSNRYPDVHVDGIFWGKLADEGEKIRLRNSEGNTVVSVEYDDDPPWALSPDGFGYSLVLADANGDPDRPESWRASSAVNGSPGSDDPLPAYGVGVVINEILAHSDPPFEDAIELFNPTSMAIDLSGWFLSDDLNRTNAANSYDLKKFRIPNGTVLEPGGYYVFYEGDFGENSPGTPFAFTEFGETAYLCSADAAGNLTGYVIGAKFGATERNLSVGRYQTSRGTEFVPLSRVTFGTDGPATVEQFRSGRGAPNAAPRVGPVVINEIMYNPDTNGCEFLELLNVTNVPVSINGWRLGGMDFTFPTSTVMAAGALLLVVETNHTSPEQFRARWNVPEEVPILGHHFTLENDGEMLSLAKPNETPLQPDVEIEHIRYNDKSPWPTEADGEGPSLERFAASEYGNDPMNWRTTRGGGSPGRLNSFLAGIAIAKGSSWNHHATGSDLGSFWREMDYTDSAWPDGDGPLGYGVPGLTTVLTFGLDPAHKPLTTYFRKEFVVNDSLQSITNLTLQALYDDGFVAYLNGEEILRSGSMPPGPVTAQTPAAGYNSLGYESFDISSMIPLLRLGRNILAVEVHQENPASDDLLWDASLTYDVSTQPSVALPRIAPHGGIFVNPVNVELLATPTDAAIYYTLDGTQPDISSIPYTAPFSLGVSSVLKVRAFKEGYNESGIASAEFMFLPLDQDSDQDGLPDWWEWAWFADGTAAEPLADPDNDGSSNLDEFACGTDPRNSTSVFKIVNFRMLDTTHWELQWSSASNRFYDVEAVSALGIANTNIAVLLGTNLVSTPPVNTFTGTVSNKCGYVRIRVH